MGCWVGADAWGDGEIMAKRELLTASLPRHKVSVHDEMVMPFHGCTKASNGTTQLDDHLLDQVHNVDCLDLMATLPSESIDLFVTSPPYNIKNSTGNGLKDGRGGKWSRAALINGYDSTADNLPYEEYVKWQRSALGEMMRLLTPTGAIFYNHKWRVQGGLLQDRSEIVDGFPVRQIIIWRRKGGINFNRGYFLPTYEVIYLIAKPAFRLREQASSLGDVWEISQERNNPHPAPFPVELARRCIASTDADIVMDPFIGSGTVAIAAEELGRRWIGCELSEEYCSMTAKRIADWRSLNRAVTEGA